MKKGTIAVSVICMVLGIYIVAVCLGYPRASAYGTGVPGPGLWPGVIAGGLFLVSAGLLVHTLRTKNEGSGDLNMLSEGPKRVYITMGILILYVAVLSFLGFIISSVVMLFVFIQWFGKFKIWISLGTALGMTLVVYFVFKMLLNVPVDFGIFYL